MFQYYGNTCLNKVFTAAIVFPQHYLCDPGIPLPKMEVTFSMRRLSKIEEECKQYMTEIQKMHRQLQEQRENEVHGFVSEHFIDPISASLI